MASSIFLEIEIKIFCPFQEVRFFRDLRIFQEVRVFHELGFFQEVRIIQELWSFSRSLEVWIFQKLWVFQELEYFEEVFRIFQEIRIFRRHSWSLLVSGKFATQSSILKDHDTRTKDSSLYIPTLNLVVSNRVSKIKTIDPEHCMSLKMEISGNCSSLRRKDSNSVCHGKQHRNLLNGKCSKFRKKVQNIIRNGKRHRKPMNGESTTLHTCIAKRIAQR